MHTDRVDQPKGVKLDLPLGPDKQKACNFISFCNTPVLQKTDFIKSQSEKI